MSLKPLSTAQIKATFGEFAYTAHPIRRGAVRQDPAWVAAQIVSVTLPGLRGVPTYGGHTSGRIRIHRKIADPLAATFTAIRDLGLTSLIMFWGGSHVARHKGWNPKRGLSSHSWGIALDLNPQWNGYGQPPAALGKEGSLCTVVPVFAQHGFCWGGTWTHPDGMHFEFADLDLLA